jgi:hypothetical protein
MLAVTAFPCGSNNASRGIMSISAVNSMALFPNE